MAVTAELMVRPPPALSELTDRALQTCPSPNTRRVYRGRLLTYLEHCGGRLDRDSVLDHMAWMKRTGSPPSMIAQTVSAIKCLAREAEVQGLLPALDAYGIDRVKPPRVKGVRRGNWLTLEQCQALISMPGRSELLGLRDAALIALMLGCGLRRSEAAEMTWDCYQEREGRMMLVDFRGKGGRLRTIPVAEWVRRDLDAWRAVNPSTRVFGIGAGQIWSLVRKYAAMAQIPQLAPHDLRRTLAHLMRRAGAELEQIQAILGHSSISTTERYLGWNLEMRKGKAATDLVKMDRGE